MAVRLKKNVPRCPGMKKTAFATLGLLRLKKNIPRHMRLEKKQPQAPEGHQKTASVTLAWKKNCACPTY